MTGPSPKRKGFGLIGLGAAACVACCASPILAFLGGLTFAGVASTLVIGIAGLGLAAVAAAAGLNVRNRHRNRCRDVAPGQPVRVSPPTSKATR